MVHEGWFPAYAGMTGLVLDGSSENLQIYVVAYLENEPVVLSSCHAFPLDFCNAALNGHLSTLKWLAEKAPDELTAMITADDYSAFRTAVAFDHLATLNWLLQNRQCLAYAEAHTYKYDRIVNPFIQELLQNLHQERDVLLMNHPNAVFDIEDAERAKYYFYILRNLIRRNDRALDDSIRFLLDIPSLKALVHQEITPGESNELLRLAMACNNPIAANLLLNIPAVRELAQRNHFYHEEARAGVDLRQLARDRESSMVALSTGEAKRLERALQYYQPRITAAGMIHVMSALQDTLVSRYKANPARIRVAGNLIELPLDYASFAALNLQGEDLEQAHQAYYRHPEHSAWRYLSKPNPWMHAHASYVYISEDRRERWSTFEEYQSLIAMFYLAAIDETTSPIEGHTIETRLNHFIQEIALIGRAHNWDKLRLRNGKQEEYDDLEGDRPSCFSGVKRRLFQSVIGHPLLTILTEDNIKAELRDFALSHFKSLINRSNQQTFKEAFDELIDLSGEGEALHCLDIPIDKQACFHQYLSEKYGTEYTSDGHLLNLVQDCFALEPKSNSAANRCHAMKLEGLTKLAEYVNRLCEEKPTTVSELSVFQPSTSKPTSVTLEEKLSCS